MTARDRFMCSWYVLRLNAYRIFLRTPLRAYNTGLVLGGLSALTTAALIYAIVEAIR